MSKSETSDFDAIQYPPAGGYWIARSIPRSSRGRAMTAERFLHLAQQLFLALAPQVLRIGHVWRAHCSKPMAGGGFCGPPPIILELNAYLNPGIEQGRPPRPHFNLPNLAIAIPPATP